MLVILSLTIAVAIGIGFARGGRMHRLAHLRLEWGAVLPGAVLLGILPAFAGGPSWLTRVGLIAAYCLVAVFLVRNMFGSGPSLKIGIGLLLAGWLLNATVIGLNGAMPLSLWAYEKSGQTEAPTPGKGGFFKIEIADSDSKLRFLGDAIPIRPIRQVLSLGDLILVVGVAHVIAAGMQGNLEPDL